MATCLYIGEYVSRKMLPSGQTHSGRLAWSLFRLSEEKSWSGCNFSLSSRSCNMSSVMSSTSSKPSSTGSDRTRPADSSPEPLATATLLFVGVISGSTWLL
eukprot:scaffold39931_cov51-Prasinocladus_malaysianus.AAC.1